MEAMLTMAARQVQGVSPALRPLIFPPGFANRTGIISLTLVANPLKTVRRALVYRFRRRRGRE